MSEDPSEPTQPPPPTPPPSPPPSPEVEAEPFDPVRDAGPTIDAPGPEPRRTSASKNTLWPTLCHLSPIVGWAIALPCSFVLGALCGPFCCLPLPPLLLGGVILPLVIWQSTRADDPEADDQGREVVNFQLNVLGLSFLLTISCLGICFLPLLWAVSLILSLVGALQAAQGKRYRYPLIIRVLHA